MSIEYKDGKPRHNPKKVVVHAIPPEKISRPRWIDVGTVGIYLHKEELRVVLKALDIARDHIIYDDKNSCDAARYAGIEQAIDKKLKEKERSDKAYGAKQSM